MKKTLLVLFVISSFSITSCSRDNDSSSSKEYPRTVNIKFEITTTRNSDAIINRTMDNETKTDDLTSLPYSFTYVQQEVNEGAYLKLVYRDNGVYVVSDTGSSWTDYDAVLSISVENEVVETKTFQMTEGLGIVQIDYTFE